MSVLNRCRSLCAALLWCCLSAAFSSHAEVRYIPVTSADDLLPWQVYVLGNSEPGIVAVYENGNLFSTAEAISKDGYLTTTADNVMNLIADYVTSFSKKFPWRLSINSRINDGGLLSYNSATQRLYMGASIGGHDGDPDENSDRYAAAISADGEVTFYGAPAAPVAFIAGDGGAWTLNCATSDEQETIPARLFRKDVFDLHIIDPKVVYTPGDVIRIHITTYPTENPHSEGRCYYTFTQSDELMTPDEIFDNYKGRFKNQSEYPDEVVEIPYPGGDVTLWFFREHYYTSSESDVLRVKLTESRGVTSADEGHFTHPSDKGYEIGDNVGFTRQSDVKIYYTLDGQDPVIANVEKATSRSDDSDETEDEETPEDIFAGDQDTEHSGKTYDLDLRPIKYDGTPLNIKYIAHKEGYTPSEVGTLQIEGSTSLIAIPQNIAPAAEPEYYDLTGRKIPTPTIPGIYLRTTPAKTEKILIR